MPLSRLLTDDQVREIRQSHLSSRVLAREYDVSHPTILNVRDRRTYKNVPDHLGHGIKNQYVQGDPVPFLSSLPDGYCGTAVTAPPIRQPPSVIGQVSGWTIDSELVAQHRYVDEQRRVIQECLRVVGPEGVLLYHHRYGVSTKQELDTRQDIISGFPLRQIIIWNHQLGLAMPSPRQVNRVPNNYGVVFVFAGPRWSIPQESVPHALAWGDVWDIGLDSAEDFVDPVARGLRQEHGYYLPAELLDRCLAFGSGMVLDPFAATGAVALAAIRAGRDWLACESDPAYAQLFQMRVAMAQ